MQEKYVLFSIKEMEKLQKEYSDYIFRGQLKLDYKLNPGLFRDLNKIKDPYNQEKYKKEHDWFKENISKFIDISDISWSSQGLILDKPFTQLMQHYRYQANLLDWSTNLKTACFMIVNDRLFNNYTDYSVIYMIKKDYAKTRVDTKQQEISNKDDFSIYDPLNLLGVNKNYIIPKIVLQNRRILIQNGLFTYRGVLSANLIENEHIEKIYVKFTSELAEKIKEFNLIPKPETDFELLVDSFIQYLLNR